jgi:hypothetical protein
MRRYMFRHLPEIYVQSGASSVATVQAVKFTRVVINQGDSGNLTCVRHLDGRILHGPKYRDPYHRDPYHRWSCWVAVIRAWLLKWLSRGMAKAALFPTNCWTFLGVFAADGSTIWKSLPITACCLLKYYVWRSQLFASRRRISPAPKSFHLHTRQPFVSLQLLLLLTTTTTTTTASCTPHGQKTITTPTRLDVLNICSTSSCSRQPPAWGRFHEQSSSPECDPSSL